MGVASDRLSILADVLRDLAADAVQLSLRVGAASGEVARLRVFCSEEERKVLGARRN